MRSRRELALRAGISHSTLTRAMHDERPLAEMMVLRIAHALDRSIDEIAVPA